MNPDPAEERSKPPRLVLKAAKRIWAGRTPSFTLLMLVLGVALLGPQMVFFRDDPQRYGLILILTLAFFLVGMLIAIIECLRIFRKHLKQKEAVYRTTLGDPTFADELRSRLEGKDGKE